MTTAQLITVLAEGAEHVEHSIGSGRNPYFNGAVALGILLLLLLITVRLKRH